jgi:hypothetical protein
VVDIGGRQSAKLLENRIDIDDALAFLISATAIATGI